MLIRPTLLLEPSGEPLLNLFLRNHSTRAHVGKALRDLLLHVDVVLDVLERRVIRKLLKELLHFLFRCLHRNLHCMQEYGSRKGRFRKGLLSARWRTVGICARNCSGFPEGRLGGQRLRLSGRAFQRSAPTACSAAIVVLGLAQEPQGHPAGDLLY